MANTSITAIGFDADDTLWQNEQFFRLTEERFAELLAPHVQGTNVPARLLEAEKRNLEIYGFGIKGFVLSMIETAIELTNATVPAEIIQTILDYGREMLNHPVHTLPQVRQTLEALDKSYPLILITKGDLFDQERKLAASGLGDLFDAVEIVSRKDAATYTRIFDRHGDGPARGMMVGNSMKSDVLPMIEAGGIGVYVPHTLTWILEHAEEPQGEARYFKIEHLGELHTLLERLP